MKQKKRTKELEALEKLGSALCDIEIDDEGLVRSVIHGERGKNFKIVQKGLKRLEKFDKAVEDVKILSKDEQIEIYKKDFILGIFAKDVALLKEISNYALRQGNVDILFSNAILGLDFQDYCKNCREHFGLVNPIEEKTYNNFKKYLKNLSEQNDKVENNE